MAKIQLVIDAEDADDLRNALLGLVTYGANEPEYDEEDEPEAPQVGATEDAEPGERQRRKRRTKAEMAAARAAESGQDSSASATDAPSAQSNGGDPFMDQVKRADAELKAAENGAVTLPMIRAQLSELLEAQKLTAPSAQALFHEVTNNRAGTMSQLAESDYAPLYARLKELSAA